MQHISCSSHVPSFGCREVLDYVTVDATCNGEVLTTQLPRGALTKQMMRLLWQVDPLGAVPEMHHYTTLLLLKTILSTNLRTA
jgi:hypothetical protein